MKPRENEHYFDLGGTIRACSAEQTLAKIRPLLKKIGITRVANVTGLDNIGIPVAVSIRPNAKHLSVSQGKGPTWELAQVSAIMESIEGYHAENPRAPDLMGSYDELVKHYPVVDLQLIPSGFFQLADFANKTIPWIKGIDLINQQEIYLPHALICLDSTQPHPEYSFFSISSNGLASGNELDEAICHALCEIIERDCVFRWQQLSEEEKNATQLDLSTIDSELNQQLLAHFSAANIQVQVWDVVSDLGIPAFQCRISDSNVLRGLGSFTGSGAHLSKEVALSRALTEAAQSRLTLISGSRDDVFPEYYQQSLITNAETCSNGTKKFSDCPAPNILHSFEANRREIMQRLVANGINNVWMVEHTKTEFDIAVVHVYVPQLQFNGMRI